VNTSESKHHFDYPLILEPRFDAKIWGGRRLETVLGKALPGPDPFGESLESDTESRVSNGTLSGRTLREVIALDPEHVLGARGVQASGTFGDLPLLAKFIDATDVLSVQVHPNDDEAAPLRKRGKTEAWHVIHAEPGATLITGLMPGTRIEEVANAIENGVLEDLVLAEVVRPGDTLLVPAGTTHAIGAGVLLYEIQQASDVTFRMYDWNRTDDHGNPRELHVRQSLEVLRPESVAQRIKPLHLSENRALLAACRYFALERWDIAEEPISFRSSGQSFRLISCLERTLAIETERNRTSLSPGVTALLPASIAEFGLTGPGTALVSYVPDLEHEIRAPLRARGYSNTDISRLAGDLPDLE
jgi:mannose-6-phosphate isomerase